MNRILRAGFYGAALLLLTACLTPPPMNESLRAQLPALFNNDQSSYVLAVKPTDIGFAVEHRLFFNGDGPKLIGTQEAYVWKVAPGVHFLTYSMWMGGGTTRLEVKEGDRVVMAVVGGDKLQPMYFFMERENIGAGLRLKGYFDLSNEYPPEPLPGRSN